MTKQYICPYCKTPLVPYKRINTIFYCECHPLKDYTSLSSRLFSWKYDFVINSWEYIEKKGIGWVKVNEKPTEKQVFIFR
jgi:RNase P subunit RPR2